MARVTDAAPLAGGAGNGGTASLLRGAAEIACLCGALALARVDFWAWHLALFFVGSRAIACLVWTDANSGWIGGYPIWREYEGAALGESLLAGGRVLILNARVVGACAMSMLRGGGQLLVQSMYPLLEHVCRYLKR